MTNCQVCEADVATWRGLDIDGVTELDICERCSYNTRFWGVWPLPVVEKPTECTETECNAPADEQTAKVFVPGVHAPRTVCLGCAASHHERQAIRAESREYRRHSWRRAATFRDRYFAQLLTQQLA